MCVFFKMLFCYLVITVCACTFVTCTLIKINQSINQSSTHTHLCPSKIFPAAPAQLLRSNFGSELQFGPILIVCTQKQIFPNWFMALCSCGALSTALRPWVCIWKYNRLKQAVREAATICLRPSTPHAAAQHALLPVAVGAMNIHDVRDRQTSDSVRHA